MPVKRKCDDSKSADDRDHQVDVVDGGKKQRREAEVGVSDDEDDDDYDGESDCSDSNITVELDEDSEEIDASIDNLEDEVDDELEASEVDKDNSDAELSLHDSDDDERIQGEWLHSEERSEEDESEGSIVDFIVDDEKVTDSSLPNESLDVSTCDDDDDDDDDECAQLRRECEALGAPVDAAHDVGVRLRSGRRVVPRRLQQQQQQLHHPDIVSSS